MLIFAETLGAINDVYDYQSELHLTMSNDRVQLPHRDLPGGLPDHMRAIIESNRANDNAQLARRPAEIGGHDAQNRLEEPRREKDIETILNEASEEEGALMKKMCKNGMMLVFTRCNANDATFGKLTGELPFSDSSAQRDQENSANNGTINGSLINRSREPLVPKPIVLKQEIEDDYASTVSQSVAVKEEPDDDYIYNHPNHSQLTSPVDVKMEDEDDDGMSELHPVLSDYGSALGEMSDGSFQGYESEHSRSLSSEDDMPLLMPQNGVMDGMPVLKREGGSPDSLQEQMPALERQRKQVMPTHIPQIVEPLRLYQPRGVDLLEIFFVAPRAELLASSRKQMPRLSPVKIIPITTERKNRRKQAKPMYIPPDSFEQPEQPVEEQPKQLLPKQEHFKQEQRKQVQPKQVNELPLSTTGIAKQFFRSDICNKFSLADQFKFLQVYKPPPPSEQPSSSSVKVDPPVKKLPKNVPKIETPQRRGRGRPRGRIPYGRIPGQPRKKDRESIRTIHFEGIKEFDLSKRPNLKVKVAQTARYSKNSRLTITRNRKAGYKPYSKFPYSILFGQYNWSNITRRMKEYNKKVQIAVEAKRKARADERAVKEAQRAAKIAQRAAKTAQRAAKTAQSAAVGQLSAAETAQIAAMDQLSAAATPIIGAAQHIAQTDDFDQQIALAVQDQEYGAQLSGADGERAVQTPHDASKSLPKEKDASSDEPTSSNGGCLPSKNATPVRLSAIESLIIFNQQKCKVPNVPINANDDSTPTTEQSQLGKEIESSLKPNVEPVNDLLGEERTEPVNGNPENNVADKPEDTSSRDEQVNHSTSSELSATRVPEIQPVDPPAPLPQSENTKSEGEKNEAVGQKALEAAQQQEDFIQQPEVLAQKQKAVDGAKEIQDSVENQAAEQEMREPQEQVHDEGDQLHRDQERNQRKKVVKEEKETKEREAAVARERRNQLVPPSQSQNKPVPSDGSSSQAHPRVRVDLSRVKQEVEEPEEQPMDPVIQNYQSVFVKQEMDEAQDQPIPKRGRGRPRKYVHPNVLVKPDPDAPPPPRQYTTRRSAAQSNDLQPPAKISKSNDGNRNSTQTSGPVTRASSHRSSMVSNSNNVAQSSAGGQMNSVQPNANSIAQPSTGGQMNSAQPNANSIAQPSTGGQMNSAQPNANSVTQPSTGGQMSSAQPNANNVAQSSTENQMNSVQPNANSVTQPSTGGQMSSAQPNANSVTQPSTGGQMNSAQPNANSVAQPSTGGQMSSAQPNANSVAQPSTGGQMSSAQPNANNVAQSSTESQMNSVQPNLRSTRSSLRRSDIHTTALNDNSSERGSSRTTLTAKRTRAEAVMQTHGSDNQSLDRSSIQTPQSRSSTRRSGRLQDQTPTNVDNQQNSAESVATPSIDNQSRSSVHWNANVTDNKNNSSTSSQAGKKRTRVSESDKLRSMDFGPREGGTLADLKLDAKRRTSVRTPTATEETNRTVTRRSAAQRKSVVNQEESESESESEEDEAFEDEEVERDDDDEDFVPEGLDKNEKRKIAEEKERLEKQKLEEIRAKKAQSREKSNSALPQSQDDVVIDDQVVVIDDQVVVIDDQDETEKDDSGPSTSGIIYPHQIAALYSNAPPAKKYKATMFSFPSNPSQVRNVQPSAPGRRQSTPQNPNAASRQPATTIGGKPIIRISDVPVFTGSFQSTPQRPQGNQPNISSRGSLNLPLASASCISLSQGEHDSAVRDSLTVKHVDQPAPPKEVNFNKFPVKQIPRPTQQHGAPQQYQAQRQAQPQGVGPVVGFQRNQLHQQQPIRHSNLLEQMQLTLQRQQASKSTYRPILPRPVAAAMIEAVQANPSDSRPQYQQPFQRMVPHSPPVPQAPQNLHRQAPRQNQLAVTSQRIHQQMPRSAPRSTHPQGSRNGSQQIQAPRIVQNSHVNPQQAGHTSENPIVIDEPASMQIDPVDPELTVREFLAIPKNIAQQQRRVSPAIRQQIVTPQGTTDASENPPQNRPQEVPPNAQEPQEVQPLTPPRAPEQVQTSPQVPATPATPQQNLRETAPLLYAELTGQPIALVTVPENFQHKDLRKDLFPLQAMHRFEARPELPPLQISNNAICLIPENKTNDYMKWDREDLLNWGKMFLDDIGQREMKKLYDDNIDGSTLSNMFDTDARSQLPAISSGTFFKIRNNAAAVVNRYNELRFKHDTALFDFMRSQTQ